MKTLTTAAVLLPLMLLAFLARTPIVQSVPRADATTAAIHDPFAFIQADTTTAPATPALRLDPALRNQLDFYLAALADKQLSRAQIERELEQIHAPAGAEATLLLSRYIAYTNAIQSLNHQSGRTRLLERRQLRLRFFSAAEYANLFALEDANDLDTVGRMAIMQNPQMGSTEQAAALAVLDTALPTALGPGRHALHHSLHH